MTTDIQASNENYEILKGNNKPNPTDADKELLKRYFAENPKAYEDIANLSGRLETMITKKLGGSHLVQESYRHKLAAMRDNLGWQTASEIEKILIEQVCLNWLRHNFLEVAHFEKTQQSHSTEVGLYWDRILTGAQRRYLRACESLAKVRKLLSDAELKEQQARNQRSKSTAIANQLLKDLTR